MKLDKVKLILTHLGNIKDCEKLMKTIESYENSISPYPCKKITKKKKDGTIEHYRFYEITGRSEDHHETTGEKLGKLSEDLYNENKIQIEVLRLLGLKNELKELIEKLNKKNKEV